MMCPAVVVGYFIVTMLVIYIDAAISVATKEMYNFRVSLFLSILWPMTVPAFIWHANKESGK